MTRIQELLLELGDELAANNISADVCLWTRDFSEDREHLLAFVDKMGGTRRKSAFVPLSDDKPAHVIECCQARIGSLSVSAQKTREATHADVETVDAIGVEAPAFRHASVA